MSDTLLPSNATPVESAIDLAGGARFDLMEPGADAIRGWRWVNPQPDVAPFLVWEFGLGVLSPYVDNVYDLIDQGIHWERLRGTHMAFQMGLGFIGYSGPVIDPPVRRVAWADYQIALDRVRDQEADLVRIDGIAKLSQPARSSFRRGYSGYDVPATEFSWTKLSGSILSDDSGVRVDPEGPKWSFGRKYETDITLTQAELEALGVWIADTGTGAVAWADLNIPWTDVIGAWNDLGPGARVRTMAQVLSNFGGYVAFYDAGGAMIGARRARALHQVQAGGSTYSILGGGWDLSDTGDVLYVEALTGFGDGFGSTVAEVGILFGAAPVDLTKPGKRWCTEAELTAPYAAVARHPVSIEFGETVRERVAVLLRFT